MKMKNQFAFTDARVGRAQCAKGAKRSLFQDESCRELLLQVTCLGAKSFYCRAWDPAKQYTHKVYLGKAAQLSIEDARRKARELALRLDQGESLLTQRQSIRSDATFADAFQAFLSAPAGRLKKGPRREATVHGYKKQYRAHLDKAFGRRKLVSITSEELDDFHSRVGESSGQYAANRLITLTRAVFNDAIKKGWKGENPACAVDMFPERTRSRFLEEHEVGPFLDACEFLALSRESDLADLLLLALFTGVRKRNLCAAAWQSIDRESGVWSISAEQTKNGEPHVVYLSQPVLELLSRREARSEGSPWVFPAKSQSGHVVSPERALAKAVAESGIDGRGVNLHCLRHTFITYADDLGLPSAVRKRLAGHKGRGDVTSGYTHARESRVREAYQLVAEHIATVGTVAQNSAAGSWPVRGRHRFSVCSHVRDACAIESS